ncbi:MAG TPA: hypothetical protein DGD08_18220 [Gemmatimonas aurantiaca]|uniref:DUF6036 domain-containing protein n=2 Tax=Gemmatimonas aurantiaca TaxID=173480 RepID=C1AE35_GEMAT|nr:DUF6036 family nucleotidyltransferase [Gemmatimonas aurantiaca]BAH40762.1 hypothetical protein GAU_3720 [Gemmatimonas aurantiaca T-27]HCT59141.1 hypothetical protein [Gemmatimonas aurantiaca]
MREVATSERIDRFLAALAQAATVPTTVYLVGGATAVLTGWRESTRDIDLIIRPESDSLLRAIPRLKDQLAINVEFAAPDHFIPVPPHWEERSPIVKRIGLLTVCHYDLTAQALAKIERSHLRDLADVRAMLKAGLVTVEGLRAAFTEAEADLYRYPAVDPESYRQALDEVISSAS